MKHLTSFSSLLFVAALICSPFLASATAGAVPIDGGLSLLVAAGVGYGAKKAAAKKKAK
jgi:hypothetical protein